MTLTLNDVAYLLHIPITRRLIKEEEEEEELSHEQGIQLMQDELCFTEEEAMDKVEK